MISAYGFYDIKNLIVNWIYFSYSSKFKKRLHTVSISFVITEVDNPDQIHNELVNWQILSLLI